MLEYENGRKFLSASADDVAATRKSLELAYELNKLMLWLKDYTPCKGDLNHRGFVEGVIVR